MALVQASLSPSGHELAGCGLFTGLSATQLTSIASLITERLVERGTVLMREGDAANELVIILEGSVEVIKRVAESGQEHRLATLHEGTTLGEMTLVDRAPRSATARTVTPSRIGILSMDHLAALATIEPEIERLLLRNLANELSGRLRSTNVTAVAALEQQLELERTRALMGRFIVFMSFMTVTYTFILKLGVDVLPANITPSSITIPITFVYAGALYHLMRRTGLPFHFFGLTLPHWRPAFRDALVWTVATCALATVFKMALIWWTPSFADQRLFNVSGILDPRTTWIDLRASLMLAIVYAAVAPLQEFIVRGGLQTALQRCLVGRSATARAIVVSNALFASAHLHLSISFAIVAFFPGLVWGVMFARRRNVAAVAVSHVLCGWFAFLVLGFEPWY
jgi:CRP-like cAMP-binding protein